MACLHPREVAPGQNWLRKHGFGTLNYEQLFLEEIDLVLHVKRYRTNYNTIRPHEALSWHHPPRPFLGMLPVYPCSIASTRLGSLLYARIRLQGPSRRSGTISVIYVT